MDKVKSTICTQDQTLQDVKLLAEQYELDKKEFADVPQGVSFEAIDTNNEDVRMAQLGSIVDYVLWQIDLDRKTKALKQLQGHIWNDGYLDGSIKGHVYDEVPDKLKEWTEQQSILLGIYSSGSVLAQRLLFGHTPFGDLTKHISFYFDTNVGAKQEVVSYERIASQVELPPAEIVFLTDISKEAKAATEAGLVAVLLDRDGKLTAKEKEQYQHVENFNEINFV